MARVLIVEDQATDVRFAADVVRSLGMSDIEARSSAVSAKAYLEDASEKDEAPELIVLDLDLGYDNGFEILRYWHSQRRKCKSRMVVWTIQGKEHQDMCKLFGVDAVVAKWEGAEGLASAIKRLNSKPI